MCSIEFMDTRGEVTKMPQMSPHCFQKIFKYCSLLFGSQPMKSVFLHDSFVLMNYFFRSKCCKSGDHVGPCVLCDWLFKIIIDILGKTFLVLT